MLALIASAGCVGVQAPSLDDVTLPPDLPSPQRTVIVAADQSHLATLFSENRSILPLERIPVIARYAVLAVEDRRFYDHNGVDGKAIGRAARANLGAGERLQGGSTITEQYVKTLWFRTEPRTVEQKLREATLALKLESVKTKEEILEGYLNTIYFGEGAYGIQAASERFFRKSADSLNPAEAALLAGLIRAPETYNPRRNLRIAFERRNVVLEEMARNNYLSRNEAELAKRLPVTIAAPETAGERFPYFVDYVKRSLLSDSRMGDTEEARAHRLYRGGLRIHTTIVPELQEAAESAVNGTLDRPGDPDAGLTSIENETGYIVAMVGGRDFSASQYNLAVDAHRQPGSTFKVFALVAALQAKIPPETRLDGTPRTFRLPHGELWHVQNYSRGGGNMTLRDATIHSVNAAYADLVTRIGPSPVVLAAGKMGIQTPINQDYSIVLGGLRKGVNTLEMANAFATLANRGTLVPASGVKAIDTPDGGRIDMSGKPTSALPPGVAWLTTQILQEAVARGTGKAAILGSHPVAGKTGTTSNWVDAWFTGYTPDYSTAVWVGHVDANIPMYSVHGVRVAGGTFPAQIWRAYMRTAQADRPPRDFPFPDHDIVRVTIDPRTGRLAGEYCTNRISIQVITTLAPEEVEHCPAPESEPLISDTIAPVLSDTLAPGAGGPKPTPWIGGGDEPTG